ncbi:methyltransferase domain-containing protein (plasmid) [Vibrio cyclitrophicus]|uniref:class I SAM-dependent methyltransferase n=1 Tax=Vibrio cyclitrophicus TaxID=47951 RepID=UPI000C851EB4|nr:class I SAM-dependent methyltransferase [Vibrio cyclitrophicus]PMH47298.1 hypothetical protein BCU67_21085 [Vibrio cyclitrophicus]PMK98596.1 hypothetical protein BCT87_20920 [Vibrio cyclitrophicus]UPR28188.1 methyltransferase domain-containing protein [Vibrio cyclitrophicus]
MELFNNLIYVKNSLDDTIIYNERQYYRYMDKIYIPSPPSELNINDVSSLSEIRIRLNGDVIDYDYTESVIELIINNSDIKEDDYVIDFGCGGGTSFNVFSKLNIKLGKLIGLDISEFAVLTAEKVYSSDNASASVFGDEAVIDAGDNSVDAVISSFVMHFNIYESQLKELYRVLKVGGKFVYNDYVYHKYLGHSKRVIRMLEEQGFIVEQEVVEFRAEGVIKKHLIVTAMK